MTLEANDTKDALIDYEIRSGISMNKLPTNFFLDDISRAVLKGTMTGEENKEEIYRVISFLAGYAHAQMNERRLKFFGITEK